MIGSRRVRAAAGIEFARIARGVPTAVRPTADCASNTQPRRDVCCVVAERTEKGERLVRETIGARQASVRSPQSDLAAQPHPLNPSSGMSCSIARTGG